MLTAEVLVAIPVNLRAHHVVHRLMFVALAITIHRLHIVVRQHVTAIADLPALKNAGMITAANVTAERLAGNTSLYRKL